MPDNKFIEGDPRGADLSGADSWVAKNPSTPPEVLTELAHDEEWYIRVIPAHNPSTPSEVLARLAGDESKDVRYEVAANPSTPSEVLAVLARDEGWEVRDAAVANQNTPSEVQVPPVYDDDEDGQGLSM